MDCIFCKIVNKEIPATIVYEDDDIIAFNDINPVAPIHILIVPKKHIPTLNDVDENDATLIGKVALIAQKLVNEKNIAESGYRLIVNCNKDAGQEVFHIHWHLIGGKKLGKLG